MNEIELSERIYEKLLEIREMYLQAYPKGDYLSLDILKPSCEIIMFDNNQDKDFPIDFWRKLSKKQMSKEPISYAPRLTPQPPEFEDYDGYADGQPVYDCWKCPNCGSEYDIEEKHDYCPNCGQAIDWSDVK